MHTSPITKVQQEIPIVQKLYDLYKTFYGFAVLFPKKDKYTLGAKCEQYIINTLELILAASAVTPAEKLGLLRQANVKFDTLKVFLRLSREIGAIDAKKYLVLQREIQEIGRMLGGWQRSLSA
ncbi:MAG: diversity-generating retroelement protein Avd [Patescibacteria group bacterium]